MFRKNIDRRGNGECWPWVGKSEPNKHYGYLKFRNQNPYWAHRLAWEIEHGVRIGNPLLVVCHKCDNPPCCNPNHLFLGSNKDNQRDRAMKHHAWHG